LLLLFSEVLLDVLSS